MFGKTKIISKFNGETRTQYSADRLPRMDQKTYYRDTSERIIKIVGKHDNKPIWIYLGWYSTLMSNESNFFNNDKCIYINIYVILNMINLSLLNLILNTLLFMTYDDVTYYELRSDEMATRK